jgi:hydrogenase maturation protein HypF
MPKLKGIHIHISGIVQGVGFRPFVYNLAQKYNLKGWVKNTSSGLDIQVDGLEDQLEVFTEKLKSEAPSLASLDQIEVKELPVSGFGAFEILQSESIPSAFQPISPDVCVCPDCASEMLNPKDRRYRYPFINCTNCGPRFTIILDIPYDRPKTSMSGFEMCPDCTAEYTDPTNRRFHAQPIACPNCGPQVWLEQYRHADNGATTSIMQIGEEAIQRTRKLLVEGKIIAIKGLGGFHLACNARDPIAIGELRRRKLRVDKAFAVMMPDMETVKRHCHVNEKERILLESPAHPIVLLRRRSVSMIPNDIAPGQRTIGVMLPYTPLHYLLLEKEKGYPDVLVMTSGNLSDEPICTDNIDARERLEKLADAFLMHDRDIHIRTDDSVVRVFNKEVYPIRRSRGYAPFPVRLPWNSPPLLAAGAELKNTFCITNENYAFLSHHIGDLENYETLKSFEEGVEHFERLFRVKPDAIAYDLHPNYLSTRYAIERTEREKIPAIGIQHHHAHIASVMAEHGLDGSQRVIGVAFDGTGYGEDGAIWGGEFLVADYSGYQRAAHLQYFHLPGGDISTRRPSRTALSLLYTLGIEWYESLATHADLCESDRMVLFNQLEKKINTPITSSMGRLFDAAAALAGVRQRTNYEAQAAIEFEALADPDEKGYYEFEFIDGEISPMPAMEALLEDKFSDIAVGKISSKFHNGLARMVVDVCGKISRNYDLSEVALSGGVWQNITLLQKTMSLLEKDGFTVHIHHLVPANDGGLALGQAAIAGYRLKR